MLEEIRITSLGVIESSTLELGPGLTVITGETGAGKTMLVTALGLLLGGRADTGSVRTGAKAGAGRGCGARRRAAVVRRRRWRRPAARSRTTTSCWPATSRRRAGPGRTPAERACPCRCSPTWPSRWWPCTASPTSTVCSRRGRSATRWTGSPGSEVAGPLATYVDLRERLLAVEAELAEVTSAARERAREADLLRFGLDEIAVGRAAARRGRRPRGGGVAARVRRHAACRRRTGPGGTVQRGRGPGRAGRGGRGTYLPGVRTRPRPGGGGAGRPAGRADLPAVRPGGRRGVVRLPPGHRPQPTGRACRSDGRR